LIQHLSTMPKRTRKQFRPTKKAFPSFPLEIWWAILEALYQTDYSTQTAQTVLNLAFTCRRLFQFINHLAELETPNPKVCAVEWQPLATTPLLALARRFARVCSLCNGRVRHPVFSLRELFSDLLLCPACETFHFTKISDKKIALIFDTTAGASLDQIPTVAHRGLKFYRWDDVDQLVKVKRSISEGYSNFDKLPLRKYLGNEEYSNFFGTEWIPENVDNGTFIRQMFVQEIVLHWTGKHEIPDSPSVLDSILFHEFWYRFNPTHSVPGSPEEWTWKWAHVAKRWSLDRSLWKNRPWGIDRFPFHPYSLKTNPAFINFIRRDLWGSRNDWDEFTIYQNKCKFYRQLFHVYPGILLQPRDWAETGAEWYHETQDEKLIRGALDEDNVETFPQQIVKQSRTFRLQKDPGGIDCTLILDMESVREEEDQNGFVFPYYEVVRVKKNSVEITDPGTWGFDVKFGG
jgi:hypothetical protein